MKWIVLPLIATAVLGWSGWLDRLDATTVASAELARASEEAPATTRAAAEQVESLPAIARLTTQQADAFNILRDALQVSAQRVFRLNDSLTTQADQVGDIVDGIDEIRGVVGCIGQRLRGLLGASRQVPRSVERIAATLRTVDKTQRGSIRHLKSINRKLTALGVAAEATNVKPPPAPNVPDIELPQEEPTDVDC